MTRPNEEVLEKLAVELGTTVDYLTSEYNPLEHIPAKVMEMLKAQDSMPFLMKAYDEYNSYKRETLG